MIQFKLMPNRENGSITSLFIDKEQITPNIMKIITDPVTNKTTFSVALTEHDLRELVESLNSTRPDLLEELFDKSDIKQELDNLKGKFDDVTAERDNLITEIDNLREELNDYYNRE